MTSTSVTEVRGLFMNGASGNKGGNLKASGADSFSQVFDKTNGSQGQTKVKTKPDKAEALGKAETKNPAAVTKTKVEGPRATEDVTEKVEAAMEEAAAQMMTKVSEELEVTVEEVEEALEVLGMTALDLLNAENLPKVVLQLNPELDSMALMTDENLFAGLKNLMNTAAELLEGMQTDYQLTPEEVQNFLTVMQEAAQTQVVEEMQPEPSAEEKLPTLETPAEPVVQTEAPEVVVEVDRKMEENVGSKAAEPETTKVENGEGEQGKVLSTESKEARRSEQKQNGNEAGSQPFRENLLNQLNEAVNRTVGESTSAYGVNAEDIMNQITEFIKVSVKPEMTEMELQLHPASLGNIKVQIASRDGIITASFQTQNETVKAAMEAQMIQLKENLNEQGIKVDAVEVSVASHGFERNLNQEGEEREASQSFTRKGTRRIRLDGGNALEEELPPEEQVIADMMVRNGNTVDYTA